MNLFKQDIKDIDLLKNIQPEVVANYLEKQGWQKEKQIENEAIIWNNKLSNFTLVLPLNQEVADFPVTINLLVENLAKFEEKTESEILQHLITNFPNVEIQGLVVGVKSPSGDKLSGEIDLMGVVMNKLERIKLELSDQDYTTAIRAYQERFPVLCRGDLVRENNGFVLKNICSFSIELEEDIAAEDSFYLEELADFIEKECDLSVEIEKTEPQPGVRYSGLRRGIAIASLLVVTVQTLISVLQYWQSKRPKYSLSVTFYSLNHKETLLLESSSTQEIQEMISQVKSQSFPKYEYVEVKILKHQTGIAKATITPEALGVYSPGKLLPELF